MKKITSWGRYPKICATVYSPTSQAATKQVIQSLQNIIPRGNGRSYGDSALGNFILSSLNRESLISFNEFEATMKVQSGIILDELLQFLVPKGFFLPVVPGTKYITVGGAVASDIHGKNHHKDGTFTNHVKKISMILSNGEMVSCSKEENIDLFHATCGGMGLTGFIHEVEFSLKKIQSNSINQTSCKSKNIDELFELFDHYQDSEYSVAWIDCINTGNSLGRGILFAGNHIDKTDDLHYSNNRIPIPIPLMPEWILNSKFVEAFNFLYSHKNLKKISSQKIPIDSFFFPLDRLKNWNKLYGKSGFTQYQLVLPKASGVDGIKKILQKVSQKKNASFLAVLKLFGKKNKNFLSFPMEGYTLSLDFKISSELPHFLEQLNEIVIEHQGRIYLSKDAFLSKNHFEKMYGEQIEHFQDTRRRYGSIKFESMQSRRLGL